MFRIAILAIRSAIFYIYFTLVTLIITTVCLPFAYLNLYLDKISRTWAYLSLAGLRFICGVKLRIEGKENLPEAPFLVASKHQSVLETIAFWLILGYPTYILKEELTKIPLYGLYLIKTGMISINRKSGFQSLKEIISKSKEAFRDKKIVVIFPEGTRTIPGIETRYKSGVTSIYSDSNVPVVPVALNTGCFWPSNEFIKQPGEAVIKILPAIPPGLDRREFEQKLYDVIETNSQKLYTRVL